MYPYGQQQSDSEFRLEDSLYSSHCLKIDTDWIGFPFFSERHYKLYVSVKCFKMKVTAAILASTCRCPKPVLKLLTWLFSYVNTHSNKTALLLAT